MKKKDKPVSLILDTIPEVTAHRGKDAVFGTRANRTEQ